MVLELGFFRGRNGHYLRWGIVQLGWVNAGTVLFWLRRMSAIWSYQSIVDTRLNILSL
jgi:hypothetical protein